MLIKLNDNDIIGSLLQIAFSLVESLKLSSSGFTGLGGTSQPRVSFSLLKFKTHAVAAVKCSYFKSRDLDRWTLV